jgi:hypothetical protein
VTAARVISLKAAAAEYGIGYRALLERIEVGELEAFNIAVAGAIRPCWRVAPEAVEAWLKGRRKPGKFASECAMRGGGDTALGTLAVVFSEIDPVTGDGATVRCNGHRLVIEVVRDGGRHISSVICERPGAAERLRNALNRALGGRR